MNRNQVLTSTTKAWPAARGVASWLAGQPERTTLDEHDACAIVAAVRKGGESTHGNLKRALNALAKMGHRSGDVNGEGDGCGVMTDLPRRLWAEALEDLGKPGWLSEDRRFFVGHVMISRQAGGRQADRVEAMLARMQAFGADVLASRPGHTRPIALGKLAREQEPVFWQFAGIMGRCPLDAVERQLYALALSLEQDPQVHVASLSGHTAVYKVRGSVETLYHYYPELRSPQFTTAITLGHTRYSTNTTTAFERVQPFNYLGHNGEINTIARLREQAEMLGVQLPIRGSDSQDLDRVLGILMHGYHFTLLQAIEILFPPIWSEIEQMPANQQAAYEYSRLAFGPFAQGPAGIISRSGDACAFSVDALGLRPLWFGDSEKEYFFSSEKGVYYLDSLNSDPRPLSPGEKMVVQLRRGQGVDVFDYRQVREQFAEQIQTRASQAISIRRPDKQASCPDPDELSGEAHASARLLAGFGWCRADRDWVQHLAETGQEPIGSLGFDGPLAALAREPQNIADYFKESVAVVTNPAIDREREKEHFSTRVVLGPRPGLLPHPQIEGHCLILDSPVLLDRPASGHPAPGGQARLVCLDEACAHFHPEQICRISADAGPQEGLTEALDRAAATAIQAVQSGARLIVIDDGQAWQGDRCWVDPHLLVAVVDRALRMALTQAAGSNAPQPIIRDPAGNWLLSEVNASAAVCLRRSVGLVLRSGALRNLHDVVLALGLGADAVNPYMMYRLAADQQGGAENVAQALGAGIEKVISTMGIHEARGYGRIFASLGLSEPLAMALGTINYCGSEARGLTWETLERDRVRRSELATGKGRATLKRISHFYPKVWKPAGQIGAGQAAANAFEARAEGLAERDPVTLRHILDFQFPGHSPVDPGEVDAGLTGHDLPFVISSMSFGSQGEVAFRAYAEGAYRLNMICLNGEGGEILDMMGRYPHHRGQQIASGRFGVDINLVNSSNLLEIKVGQGAKPGEGGHLPGRKVSARVAQARHARQGVDLISPSNNHDIYSIEDLAQFIEELKTANPKARIAVKVPVVPGIGIISVGIAKAGADIINLTGYDGGTGAARQHAIRHVGLPAEVGVVAAHKALVRAQLRNRVEIWCDGGMRTAADVVKMICLGANRVGFGSLAMVAIGCTICRACQTDTCHVGIATQIESREQAQAHGLDHFAPRDLETATQAIVNLFAALGEDVKKITAQLGFARTQELVGRSDLLVQRARFENLDLDELLRPAEVRAVEQALARPLPLSSGIQLSQHPLRRPRNHLTTVISDMVMETIAAGEQRVGFEDDKVTPVDRALGTHLAGAMTRYARRWSWAPGHHGVGGRPESWQSPYANGSRHHTVGGNGPSANGSAAALSGRAASAGTNGLDRVDGAIETNLHFYASSVPGNGLGAYSTDPIRITVEGGAQDGVAKGMHGGRLAILKGFNHDGIRVDGSVGKGLAYGAIGGLIIVQGDADSRACIRLSGADVIIGGEIRSPLRDEWGYLGARANVKGFLCEYMTAGSVLVLGDPGPWICAGMTGGVLYLRLQPELGFDLQAIQRRIARGAQVKIKEVQAGDEAAIQYLLGEYAATLAANHQQRAADKVLALLEGWNYRFVKIAPDHLQMDQSVSTE